MKKIKEELHLIILWNEDNISEVEGDINKRFRVVRKISVPSLDKEVGQEKRLEVLNVIYRFELPMENLISVSKGTHPMVVFVIIDDNPVYELKQTSRQFKHFNKNLFDLKHKLRKGRGNYIHATDNMEETHDDLKVLSEVLEDSSIYDEWIKQRPTFNSLTDYFEELNSYEGLEYVVMRNFDNYPDKVQLDEHADIDILTNDYFLFKAISGGKARKGPMVEDGGYKVCNKVRIDNIEVDVDVRHMGDNYYCTDWEKDILDNRVLFNGFYIMDDANHFYSLMYHGLCQKAPGGLSNTYKKKFLDFEPKMNVSINESNVHNEGFLFSTLDKFMKEKNYDYIRPNELSIPFRTMTPPDVDDIKLIKIKLGGINESTYFDGDEYEFVETWETKTVETEEQCKAEKYDISKKDRYYFTGRFCRFLCSKDKDYGYKIFIDEGLKKKEINLLFNIQNLLFRKGFAPRAHEIIKCQDDSREYFAIKMDNIKGTHVQPDEKWIDKLIEFCERNKIHREIRSIKDDCVPKNCIRTDDGEIYLVDIDQRYRMNTKNIVFIPNINLGNGRSDSYHYSVKSWKHWCEKNNTDLIVLDNLVFPIERMKITFQRYYLFDILEDNNIDYNQILMVDADTIVHPDCPNFFEETEDKYCGVAVEGCHEWVNRSINNYHNYLFKDQEPIKPWEYINGGFQIVNKKHKQFYQDVVKFYWENSDKLLYAQENFKVGTDQTPINFLLRKYNIDLKILPQCYNLQDLSRKNLLYLHENCWWTDELHFLKSGWMYHFNSIPQNSMKRDANYWIKRTYEELYK